MSAHHRALLSLRGLGRGPGRSDAIRVWMVLWSYTRHGRKNGDVWPSNATIAGKAGISVDQARRAIRRLERAGKISRRWGRPRGVRKCVRIITVNLGKRDGNPRIRVPDEIQMQAIKRMLKRVRERPGSSIALVVVIFAMARLRGGDTIHVPIAALREMTDSSGGGAFYERLAALESAGLISRVGDAWSDGIRVAELEYAEHLEMEWAIAAIELPTPRVRFHLTREDESRLASMSAAWARCEYTDEMASECRVTA